MAKHHLVSDGYQKNFTSKNSNGYRLTIIDRRTGEVIDKARATARNWTEPDWNSIIGPDGTLDATLEHEWSRLEASSLRRIREVRVGACDEVHRRAIINLFAMHFVRSRALAESRLKLLETEWPSMEDELVHATSK